MYEIADLPQASLFSATREHPKKLLKKAKPFYVTGFGAAYLGDSRDLLAKLPDSSVNLVFTSPPYALHFKKAYGNVSKADYVGWFLTFAKEIHRVLTVLARYALRQATSHLEGQLAAIILPILYR